MQCAFVPLIHRGFVVFHAEKRIPAQSSTYVLLVHKGPGTRVGPPKGSIRTDSGVVESPFDTACRELEEETPLSFNSDHQDLESSTNAIIDVHGTHYYIGEVTKEVFERDGRGFDIEEGDPEDTDPIVGGKWARLDGALNGDEFISHAIRNLVQATFFSFVKMKTDGAKKNFPT